MSGAYVTIQLSDGALALMQRLSDAPGLLNSVRKEMDIQNQLTVSNIQENRLTGKGPFPVEEHRLGQVTYQLRRSVRATKSFVVNPDRVVSSIGSNVRYAALHEYGGTVKRVLMAGSVRLRTDKGGNLLRQGKDGRLAIFAKKTHKRAVVVQYFGGKRYEAVYPARAPFHYGIQDRMEDYNQGLSNAVVRFLEGTPS